MSELELQDHMPYETQVAYKAYVDYRNAWPNISLAKLCERYQNAPESSPTTRLATLKGWSSKFQWQARVAEWQEHLQEEDELAAEAARKEARKERADLLEKMRHKLVMNSGNVSIGDPPAFRAWMQSVKDYLEQSRREHNDLPVQRSDVTSGGMVVQPIFNIEVPEGLHDDPTPQPPPHSDGEVEIDEEELDE